jgi:hypothetical protein
LNELIYFADEQKCNGIFVNEKHQNVNMLMYADDLVFVGDQVNRVQKLLNVLSMFCAKWGLQVNMKKTKAMVFRNGGIVKKSEVFYYNGKKLDIVPHYKYLGVIISSRLSWSPAQTTLAAQANKAMRVTDTVNESSDYSFKCSCKVFDKCILPILNYACEIWGTDVHKSIEGVHYKFCKSQLGVGIFTPNVAVLGDCGRDRVFINCAVRCIKYWIKLVNMPEDSLLKGCYNLQYRQCIDGKTNWLSKIKEMLFQYGYGWIWEAQSIPETFNLVNEFRQRIKDCELQCWATDVKSLPKLRTYCLFKETREEEFYLSSEISIPHRLKSQLARFRTGNHCLEIEVGRHSKVSPENRVCKFCKENNNVDIVENEYHVLLECFMYSEIRNFYLSKHYDTANHNSFICLMKTRKKQCIIDVANFINGMFKIRKNAL